jgi:Zn-finger nucleic acid-binding protein
MTAYRASAPLCPSCHQALEAHVIDAPNAVVDLCKRCGGVWIDWEDGDLTELAREVPPAPTRVIPRSGTGACPRCNRRLAVELFLGTAEVLRCGECAGAFLPYASIGKIAASTPAEARDTPDDPGAWARLIGALRRLLQGPPG